MKQYETALDCFIYAIKIDARNHYLYFKQAQLLFLLNRYEQAYDSLSIAIQLNPENTLYSNYKEQMLNNSNSKKYHKFGLELEN